MQKSTIDKLARFGLIAKGVTYLLMGALAFMAAFNLGGQSEKNTSQADVFKQIKEAPFGMGLLGVLTLGLLAYATWRFIESFSQKGEEKKFTKRARYFFSGLAYSALSYSALKLLLFNKGQSGDQKQEATMRFLSEPLGQWMVGAAALLLAGIGFYQVYYGLSEKYKKHVQELNMNSKEAKLLLKSGMFGYLARGIVWLILAYLFIKAAISKDASSAGNTSKAFTFADNSSLGSYFLAAIAAGLVAYGVFNFIRARYERFK